MPKGSNQDLIKLVESTLSTTVDIKQKFLSRISQGKLSRDENPESHFGAYFLPFNSKTKKVFLIHHKKSGLWLSPGGHMEKDELPQETLIREVKEELGLKIYPDEINLLFLLTITPINNTSYACREHFDVWYLIKTNKSVVKPDPGEFYSARWLTFSQTKTVVTDQNNLQAIGIAFKLMGGSV